MIYKYMWSSHYWQDVNNNYNTHTWSSLSYNQLVKYLLQLLKDRLLYTWMVQSYAVCLLCFFCSFSPHGCFSISFENTYLPTTLWPSLIYTLIYFTLIIKQATFSYVNQTWICSWNQPILSNKCSFFLKETTRAFGGVWTQNWTITRQFLYPLHHHNNVTYMWYCKRKRHCEHRKSIAYYD